jgi:hypothetical protein
MPQRPKKKEKKSIEPADAKGNGMRSGAVRRNKRGLLEDLPSLPLDVVYEVCSIVIFFLRL